MTHLRTTLFIVAMGMMGHLNATMIEVTIPKARDTVYLGPSLVMQRHFDLDPYLGSYQINSVTVSYSILDDVNDETYLASDNSFTDVSDWTINQKRRCNLLGCETYFDQWSRTTSEVTDLTFESELDQFTVNVGSGAFTYSAATGAAVTTDVFDGGTYSTWEDTGVQTISGKCVRPNGTTYACTKTDRSRERTYTSHTETFSNNNLAQHFSHTYVADELDFLLDRLTNSNKLLVRIKPDTLSNPELDTLYVSDAYISDVRVFIDVTEMMGVPAPTALPLMILAGLFGLGVRGKRK